MMRAVLDTNVLVSALIKREGNSNQIVLRAALEFTWLTSEYILAETAQVLTRKHIQTRYGSLVSADRQSQYLSAARILAELVVVKTILGAVTRDVKDNPVLACAVDGRADYLVTGDPHLLNPKQYQDIVLATPKQFLGILDMFQREP